MLTGQFQPTFERPLQRRFESGRMELKAPILIFGGLLIAATMARALDTSSVVPGAVDLRHEPQIVSAQLSSAPVEHDLLWMGCRSHEKSQPAVAISARCQAQSAVTRH